MSNAMYRRTDKPLNAKEQRDALVQTSCTLIEEIASISPMHAEMVQKMIGLRFETLGGSIVESDMKSLDLIVKSGNLSREIEVIVQQRALERMKNGQAPDENPPTICVSASTHRGAIRDRQKLLEKRQAIIDQSSIDVAEELRKMGNEIANTPEPTPPERATQAAAMQQPPQVKQANAPPQKTAA